MFVTCINKDDDDDSEWAAFFVASCDHRGLPSPPPPLLPPSPSFFRQVKSSAKRQTRATGEGALRKFLSKKRDESEKFSDSEVCDKIKWLAN